MHSARGGQLERGPSTSGVPLSRGGASAASEHGVAACHLCGELETEAHGLPFTDWLDTSYFLAMKNIAAFGNDSVLNQERFSP